MSRNERKKRRSQKKYVVDAPDLPVDRKNCDSIEEEDGQLVLRQL